MSRSVQFSSCWFFWVSNTLISSPLCVPWKASLLDASFRFWDGLSICYSESVLPFDIESPSREFPSMWSLCVSFSEHDCKFSEILQGENIATILTTFSCFRFNKNWGMEFILTSASSSSLWILTAVTFLMLQRSAFMQSEQFNTKLSVIF